MLQKYFLLLKEQYNASDDAQFSADCFFSFSEREWVEYFSCKMIVSSKQGGFYNTTDVLFICCKKKKNNNRSNLSLFRRFRLVKRSILLHSTALKNLKIA